MKLNWLIFGTHSTQAKQILDFAIEQKLNPIICDTNCEELLKVCKLKKIPGRLINLSHSKILSSILEDIDFVFDCHTDFTKESKEVFNYCIQTKTSYISLSKNYKMFEYSYNKINKHNISDHFFLPGIQIDTIIFDLIASRLKRILPDATSIKLAQNSNLRPSVFRLKDYSGILKLTVQRIKGSIKKLYFSSKLTLIPFESKLELSKLVSHPAVSVIWQSTKIPTIKVYHKISLKELAAFRILFLIKFIFLIPCMGKALQRVFMKSLTKFFPKYKQKQNLCFWGKAINSKNQIIWIKVSMLYSQKKYHLMLFDIIHKLSLAHKGSTFKTPSDLFDFKILDYFENVKIESSIDKLK